MSSLKGQNKDSKSLVKKSQKKMRQGKPEQKVKGMRKLQSSKKSGLTKTLLGNRKENTISGQGQETETGFGANSLNMMISKRGGALV